MCVLGGGLLAAAVLTGGPRQSNASPDEARAPIEPPKDVNWHPGAESDARVLCELISVQYRVLVLTGTDEPRYTVLSLEGDTLLERGTLSDVTAMFPTLDLAGLKDADGHSCGPLMLMDLEAR